MTEFTRRGEDRVNQREEGISSEADTNVIKRKVGIRRRSRRFSRSDPLTFQR